jgi:uncharacterized membrane protein
MRSMSGPAALALARGGSLNRLLPLLAAGEMIADKTSVIGDRTDALPLAGRAVIGALVGGIIARQARSSLLAGGSIGAAAAVAAAFAAYHARKRLPLPSAPAGMLEDLLVLGIGTYFAPSTESLQPS